LTRRYAIASASLAPASTAISDLNRPVAISAAKPKLPRSTLFENQHETGAPVRQG
jgi:hypothetical protein